MSFQEAARNEAVRESLQAIEDKIGARGFLVSLTGDSDAEIAIAYERYGEGDAAAPCLVARITAEIDPDEIDEDRAEALSDFITDKAVDASDEWGHDVAEALLDNDGTVLLINGHPIG